MKFFRKLALAALLTALLTGTCLARETFHGAYLQGFPDGWTEHLETEEPGERETARWVGVFEDWYRAQGKTARASPGKIAKWLLQAQCVSVKMVNAAPE